MKRHITSTHEETGFLKFSNIEIYEFNALLIKMPTGFLKWNLTT